MDERRVGIVDVMVCRECGLGRVRDDSRPDDYWSRAPEEEAELQEAYWAARQPVFRRALESVAKERGRGRVVDVGGGVGYFAATALELGWDAYSVDTSVRAVKAAAARIGQERSLLEAPPALVGTCDLVTLWCVLAHVPDPRALLADALRLLSRDGRLLITTPNFLFQARYAALAARVGRPIDFVAHDHFLHFTPASLERVLADVGAVPRSFGYWGITTECVLDRRLGRVLVPAKRLWNWTAWQLSRAGLPNYCSELQVEVVRAGG